MNLGGVARTDRVLDEIGGRRQCAAAADDEVLAALAAWVDQIDDVPVAKRRGRHRAARSGGLQRILGGGAVLLASFSGASVAAALTGADVPGLSSFGRAVVELVPGDQFLAQQPEERTVVEAVPAPGEAGTPARQVAVPAGATGSSGADRTGVAGRGTSAAEPRSARASAPGGPERVLTGDEGPAVVVDGRGQEQDGGATDASPDDAPVQTGPPEHAMKDRVRGPETDPTVPGHGAQDSLPQGPRGEAVAAGSEDLPAEVPAAPAAPGLAPPAVEAQTSTP
ncbi:MAG: hypothetical protein DCC50_10920 [Acidobacteria bacterium]|nr:MAG: hypothetical protein DCC50_10920 [Acidobacteriota bacterium]